MKWVNCIPILLQTLLGLGVAQQCYWPDGTDSDPKYRACNATAPVSACCSINDACTTNGWCLGSAGYVYRGAAFMPAAEALVDLGMSSSTTNSVASTTATAIVTEIVRSGGSSSVAAGSVVGAAIGSAVAGIAIGLLAGYLVWRKSRKLSELVPIAFSEVPPQGGLVNGWNQPLSKNDIQELEPGDIRRELPAKNSGGYSGP
ncbi:hypothetical protein EG329_004913 [Mollisiaceae sp. DMI_Dod_QoI]|nr:hypothetical protein EG329_004913 [Helotiales sp. DMI_Dod_QoI]